MSFYDEKMKSSGKWQEQKEKSNQKICTAVVRCLFSPIVFLFLFFCLHFSKKLL